MCQVGCGFAYRWLWQKWTRFELPGDKAEILVITAGNDLFASVSAVAMTKNSLEYQKMLKRRRTAERSGIASTLTDLPETPRATDRAISKRMWEKQLQLWRAAIKQWCRIEGVELVVVISDSKGGVARLDRHDIRGRWPTYKHETQFHKKDSCAYPGELLRHG